MADFGLHEAFATYSEGFFWKQRYVQQGLTDYCENLTTQVAGQGATLGG
jgi:hypothetical protein